MDAFPSALASMSKRSDFIQDGPPEMRNPSSWYAHSTSAKRLTFVATNRLPLGLMSYLGAPLLLSLTEVTSNFDKGDWASTTGPAKAATAAVAARNFLAEASRRMGW